MTVIAARAHLHEHQLALDGFARLVLEDLDHVHELVELLGDLFERLGLDVHDDRHARLAVPVGRPDGEGVDVEPARGEQSGHPREHARLVLDQHRDRVQAHATGASAGSSTGRSPSGPVMMSSLLAPAGTIGKHISFESTRKSMTTLRSAIDSALSITASTSSGCSARRPTHPYASASLT